MYSVKEDLEKTGYLLEGRIDQDSAYTTYYYDIKIIHKKNKSRYNLMFAILELPTYSEKFMHGLINYYKNIITEMLEHQDELNNIWNNQSTLHIISKNGENLLYKICLPNIALSNNYYIFNDEEPERQEQYVEKHKNDDFTQEMIVEFILRYHDKYSDDEITKLAKQHVQEYPNNKKYYNVEDNFYDLTLYCRPGLKPLNKEIMTYLNLDSTRPFEFDRDIEETKLLYKLFVLSYNADKKKDPTIDVTKKFKEHNNSDDFVMPNDFTEEDSKLYNYLGSIHPDYFFDFNDKKKQNIENFVQYMNNLTIEEYLKVIKFFSKFDNDYFEFNSNIFMELSELILNDDYIIDADFNDFNEVAEKATSTLYDNDNFEYNDVDDAVRSVLQTAKNPILYPFTQLLAYYINSKESVTKEDVEFLNIVAPPIDGSRYECKWLEVDELMYCGVIAAKLRLFMSNDEIIELLQNVLKLDKTLTYNQWSDYINNHDEYDKLPTAWWLELA